MKKFFYFFLFVSNVLVAQSIYKTPSGKKYHLSSCRMVKNVSKKITSKEVAYFGLTPCKICKPPYKKRISGSRNKAVGTSQSVQCRGRTKKGRRCRHKTKLANGFCYQHTNQN